MNNPNLTVGDAIALLDKVDALYYDLYVEVCKLKGLPVLGKPGRLGYADVAAVADAIEQRYGQIQKLQTEREELFAKQTEEVDLHSLRILVFAQLLGID